MSDSRRHNEGPTADSADAAEPTAAGSPGHQRPSDRKYGALGRAMAKRAGQESPTAGDVATAAIENADGGAPVDAGVRGKVEGHLGVGLGGVRVHSDELAQQSSAAMGARAFAHGSDVFLGPGESGSDLELMAHELTHVVQQGAAEPAVQRQVEVGAANSPAENEADRVAAQVAGGAPPQAMIVDDGASVQPGQMIRSQFLRELRERVTATADDALGPMWSALGCPYIEAWFNRHASTPAAELDRLAKRYSRQPQPAAATDYIAPILARVRAGIESWRGGGDVSAELSAAGVSSAAAAAPGADGAAPAGGAQRKPGTTAPVDGGDNAAGLIESLGPSEPLDSGTASRMGDAMGADLSGVEVHTGEAAAQKTADAGARALAVGEHVAFAPGEYRPGTPEGDAVLAHELAHTVQQKGAGSADSAVGGESAAHEQDADRAAAGVLGRLWGGVKSATDRAAPALTSGYQLQRCGDSPRQRITDPFVLGLQAKLDAGDKPGFFADIRGLGGSRAGDGAIRDGLGQFMSDGKLSSAEAFRAVALQELGAERSWPEPIKNFADGMDAGTFSFPGLAPAGADSLREFCLLRAGAAADGPSPDLAAQYRTRFNAKWEIAPYATLSSELDSSLDSKGPRNLRARRIFEDLYNGDSQIEDGYDRDQPPGFRNLCDTHAGPDGLNLIASPRLQELRATLNPPQVTATSTSDAAYTALVGNVRPKAEALDARDRQEIQRSHQWRLAVDDKVVGGTDSATASLRADLWQVVTTSRSAAPAPGPTPTPSPTPAPPPEPAPTPNADQRAFLRGINVTAPASPQDAESDSHDLTFQIQSSRPNPALNVRRRVVVEPTNQVLSGSEDETAWPDTSSSVPHTATVNPETSGGTSTTFTARLTMPPLAASDFAEKTATVTVNDKRIDWFKREVQAGVTCVNENDFTWMNAGSSVPFKGGQVPIRVRPRLPRANPGLTVFMDGELKRGGATAHSFPRTPFPSGQSSAPIFDTILTESSPPASGNEQFEAEIKFYGASGPAFHTVTLPFEIAPNLPAPTGGDAAQVAADNAFLNTPIGTPGFLDHMDKSTNPTWQRVANAVNSGALKVQACMIRSDAATWLVAKGHNPSNVTAYAMGGVTDARTLVAAPGAAGWRWGSFADTVFLNVTPRAGTRRSFDEMAEFLAHEGIHAADRTEAGTWGRYTTEFRAYWVMGTGASESTAFDPTMDGVGPKSPRARAIFRHLYGSSTYPFVKPAYDGNVDGFREKVDNYLYPDGINLTLSAKLTELRTEIESFSGSGYAAKKAAVQTRYNACSAGDKAEIRNNRMWRDLVEEKFTGTVRVGWLSTELQSVQIKTILGIPQ
jgi:hypothetical protein